MSDRIVLMNQGRIVQVGTPTEIYNRPQNEFASRFIGEANLLKGVIRAVSDEGIEVDADGLVVTGPAQPGFALGQPAVVSIRPERIGLFVGGENVPPTCRNVFPGTIVNTIFLGALGRYQVRLSNDLLLLVEQPTSEGMLNCCVRDEVVVAWEAGSTIILAD